MRKFYVYTLSDMSNQVFYVGKGSKTKKYDRIDFHLRYWKHHQQGNKHLYNKIKKLNGQFVVNIIFESNHEMDCFEVERDKIAEIKNAGAKLCNQTEGGEGPSGWKHTVEARRKMSLESLNRVHISKKNLKKAVEANKGKRKAEAFEVDKLYETKSIYQIKAMTGLDFNTIKKYLVEKGLYEKNKNRQNTISDSRRASISKGQRSRTDRKRVGQYTLDGTLVKVWSHQKEAAIRYGSCVGDCLRGRQKTAYNYIWKYE